MDEKRFLTSFEMTEKNFVFCLRQGWERYEAKPRAMVFLASGRTPSGDEETARRHAAGLGSGKNRPGASRIQADSPPGRPEKYF